MDRERGKAIANKAMAGHGLLAYSDERNGRKGRPTDDPGE